jgi:bacteriocin biosynthesis cyclodehydratase domain-containing protein
MTVSANNDEASRDSVVLAARYAALNLPPRPRLAPWLVAVDLGDGRLQLRSSELVATLTHPLLATVFRRIQPVVDGRHTMDEIVSSAGPDVLPTTVLFLLKLLKGRSLLLSGEDEGHTDDRLLAPWAAQLRFLSHFVSDAAGAQRVLASARLGIAGTGALAQAVSGALLSIGMERIVHLPAPSTWSSIDGADQPTMDLIVACAESSAYAFFDTVNRACLVSGRRWLRVAVSGTSAELGPTTVPHQTACYTCLDLRRRTHEADLPGYLAYRSHMATRTDAIDEGGTSAFRMTVAGQTALEVMRLLIGFAPPVSMGRYVELSAATPLSVAHDVLKVPRCPACDARRSVPEAWDRGFAMIGLEL